VAARVMASIEASAPVHEADPVVMEEGGPGEPDEVALAVFGTATKPNKVDELDERVGTIEKHVFKPGEEWAPSPAPSEWAPSQTPKNEPFSLDSVF
jgi:hypothetical protein